MRAVPLGFGRNAESVHRQSRDPQPAFHRAPLQHKTIVLITHDLDEALLLGDQSAILKDGVLRQTGTGPEILMAPADDDVARFDRDVNRARIVTCGALAIPGNGAGATALGAEQTIEQAFAALAASDAPIAVRGANGHHAGVLTRQRVFDALARTDAPLGAANERETT